MSLNYKMLMLLFASIGAFSCQQSAEMETFTGRPEVVDFAVFPFEIKDVTLLEGPFAHANELNVKVLLGYEPDRFLATFRKEAGLEPKGEHYGGWESSSIAGHSFGHYLSACAMMYQSTNKNEFFERVNYMIDELAIVQEAAGDGYIGAFPGGKRVFEEEVAQGVIRASGFDLNGIWAPWYTHHKILGGLRDAYYLCGNEKALDIAVKFADWMEGIVGHLEYDVVQEMLICEFGGMNEVLAELYGQTGEERYLNLSRVFHDHRILDSLAMGVDVLPGKHANTQIPKVTGLARRYELTGNAEEKETALFFWDRVVNYHSYVTGSNALNEYFGPPGQLNDRLGPHTGETCNVYNILRLTDHLFRWDASAEAADFYELALFNHILASQHPENGRVTYHINIDRGGFKSFQDPFAFTCCIGSGMENHAKYNENIYYHNDKELYVTQFIASELRWDEKGMILRQRTGYPEQQGTELVFECDEPVDLVLKLRYPGWADKGMEVLLNGQTLNIDSEPGSFVRVERRWENGDRVVVRIPFSLRIEAMPDNPERVALKYGPLVLAGDLGPVNDPAAWDLVYVPMMLTGDPDPNSWTRQYDDRVNAFATYGIGKPRDIELQPFYTIYDRRYSVYWDLADEDEWKELEAEQMALDEEKKLIEERTIDFFQSGNIEYERSHLFEGPQSTAHQFRGNSHRVTLANGWFGFNMKVLPDEPVALNVEYWGGGYNREKSFDILVDGKRIASEDITKATGERFIYAEYEIPEELTKGKKEVRVEIRAQARRIGGPVYGVRTVRK
jgi:uncharacterized protein